jgi:hypothetical protein
MATIASHLSDVIDTLMKVPDTYDSTQNLMKALRAVQLASSENVAPASMSPSQALINHLGSLDADMLRGLGIDHLKLQLDIANAVGDVIPHFGKYEIDPGWAESVIHYYEYLDKRVPFPLHTSIPGYTGVQDLMPPDAKGEIRVALVGDWGVDHPSYPIGKKVISNIATHKPHYVIHLGDVYYSGLPQEENVSFLADAWPFKLPETISFTLNSNHEMYAGGHGYYKTLLADPCFASQQGIGYFALQNRNWLIIGLDTAYFGRRSSRLYQSGTLGDARDQNGMLQRDWLHQLLHDPAQAGKRVIILTHHDGFDIDPGNGALAVKTLWTEMTGCVRGNMSPSGSGELIGIRDWWWYWGHVHAPIVYRRIFFSDKSSVSPRCSGHGAIPYLPYPIDYGSYGNGDIEIEWAETVKENPSPPDNTDKDRAPNGYALLTLTGPTIKEEFFDENGRSRWSSF